MSNVNCFSFSIFQVVNIMKVNLYKVQERDQKLSEVDDRCYALQANAELDERGYALQANAELDERGYDLQAGASRIQTPAEQIKLQKRRMMMLIVLGVTIVLVIGFIMLGFTQNIE